MKDVTDATFEADVLARSDQVPVVVDLWAPWCGPCTTLGPVLERVVAATGGKVELAKVNVDENPRISASFGVQSIPAVFALRDRQIVDRFVGALPEAAVTSWVAGLAPPKSEVELLIENGEEDNLRRALEIEPGNTAAVLALAELLVTDQRPEEALGILARIPETGETKRVAALARLAVAEAEGAAPPLEEADDLGPRLDALLERVRGDDEARQEFVDLLETMGPEDPRTAPYRKALTARIF
ncbi:MAG: tetratricopeptide repeat protein [Acidimicrobiales bacterium]